MFDADGQPLDVLLNRDNNLRKSVDLLAGISMGVLADGVVTDEEAALFAGQVERVAEMEPGWPVNVLLERVRAVFADGVVDEAERVELKGMMEALVGASGAAAGIPAGEALLSTALPFCSPPPLVVFPSKVFLVTGKFAYGARREVHREIESRGGLVSKSKGVTTRTDYLVVGAMASRDWKHTGMGNKIMRAVELREKGWPVRIVSEEHWVRCL